MSEYYVPTENFNIFIRWPLQNTIISIYLWLVNFLLVDLGTFLTNICIGILDLFKLLTKSGA